MNETESDSLPYEQCRSRPAYCDRCLNQGDCQLLADTEITLTLRVEVGYICLESYDAEVFSPGLMEYFGDGDEFESLASGDAEAEIKITEADENRVFLLKYHARPEWEWVNDEFGSYKEWYIDGRLISKEELVDGPREDTRAANS